MCISKLTHDQSSGRLRENGAAGSTTHGNTEAGEEAEGKATFLAGLDLKCQLDKLQWVKLSLALPNYFSSVHMQFNPSLFINEDQEIFCSQSQDTIVDNADDKICTLSKHEVSLRMVFAASLSLSTAWCEA